MALPSSIQNSRGQVLDEILHRYYRAVEQGETPRQEELLAEYPDFASELKSFFANLRHMEGYVAQTMQGKSVHVVASEGETHGASAETPRTAHFIRDYQLLKKLGEGGMGTVYLAVHTQLEKHVAIKLLRGDLGRDATAIQRFRREIKAIGRFEHDHVVRALDAGKFNGSYFLVMEFIDGADLSHLSRRCSPLQISDVCEIIRQAALGLAHAHQLGLIHRDIKPSNLMLTRSGRVKLLDLGLAQLHQPYSQNTALTTDGQMVGTFRYMAPEQLQDSRTIDATCDVYSLGVTLCELLCGELPASGIASEVCLSALKNDRSDVPEELTHLIGSMTSSEPLQRIQKASEVAERLTSWTGGHDLVTLLGRISQLKSSPASRPPIQPLPPSPPPRISDCHLAKPGSGAWGKSKAGRALAVAALLLTVLAGLWIGRSGAIRGTTPIPTTANANLWVVIDPAANGDEGRQFSGILVDEISGDAHLLAIGSNQLPPGTYRVQLGNAWDQITSLLTLTRLPWRRCYVSRTLMCLAARFSTGETVSIA